MDVPAGRVGKLALIFCSLAGFQGAWAGDAIVFQGAETESVTLRENHKLIEVDPDIAFNEREISFGYGTHVFGSSRLSRGFTQSISAGPQGPQSGFLSFDSRIEEASLSVTHGVSATEDGDYWVSSQAAWRISRLHWSFGHYLDGSQHLRSREDSMGLSTAAAQANVDLVSHPLTRVTYTVRHETWAARLFAHSLNHETAKSIGPLGLANFLWLDLGTGRLDGGKIAANMNLTEAMHASTYAHYGVHRLQNYGIAWTGDWRAGRRLEVGIHNDVVTRKKSVSASVSVAAGPIVLAGRFIDEGGESRTIGGFLTLPLSERGFKLR